MLSRMFKIAFFLSPLLLFMIPLPVGEDQKESSVALAAVVLIYGAALFRYCGKYLGDRHSFESKVPILLLLITGGFFFLQVCLGFSIDSLALVILAAAFLVSWGVLSVFEVNAKGVLALVVFVGALSLTELFLNSVPPSIFDKSIIDVKPLAPEVDRGILAYRKNGYRGRQPCKKCPQNNVRIFTIGGSSTYGIPIYYDRLTFSSVLQDRFDEERPGESYEVLNAGIAGYGITQVFDSIKTELVKYKPDIILINSWFNDSASDMNWYGMTGKSDIEAYKLTLFMRWLQNFPPYKLIHRSRLYNIYRWYVLKTQPYLMSLASKEKPKVRTRMKAEEFRTVLDDIFELSDQHGFMPVLMLEPLNRTSGLKKSLKRNNYYQVIAEAAEKYDVPLINSLKPIYERRSDWLFYDFIHPGHEGHKLLGDEIYSSLLDPEKQTKRSKALWESKGVKLDRPKAVSARKFTLDRESLDASGLVVRASLPYAGERKADLELYINGQFAERKSGLSSSEAEFSFQLKREKLLPLNKVVFKSRFDTGSDQNFSIGSTGAVSPVFLQVVSGGKDYGWISKMQVQGVSASPNQRGYNIIVLSGNTGDILSIKHFDIFGSKSNNQKLEKFFSNLGRFKDAGKPPIVIVSIKTDGIHNADTEMLSRSFKKIGAAGKLPNAFESYAVVGVFGAEPGTALEKRGRELVELEIGTKDIVAAGLLSLELEK